MGLLTNQPKKLLYILLALELLLFLEDDDLFADVDLFVVCRLTVVLFGALLCVRTFGLGELVLGFTLLFFGELVLGFTPVFRLGLGVLIELPLGLGELFFGLTILLFRLGVLFLGLTALLLRLGVLFLGLIVLLLRLGVLAARSRFPRLGVLPLTLLFLLLGVLLSLAVAKRLLGVTLLPRLLYTAVLCL